METTKNPESDADAFSKMMETSHGKPETKKNVSKHDEQQALVDPVIK